MPDPKLLRATLSTQADAAAFFQCLDHGKKGEPLVRIHCKALGDSPIYLRPGTTDARVFDDTFVGLYHLPEIRLPERPVILDLGANIGLTALHYAALFPNCHIICVEMDAGNVEALRLNTAPIASQVTVIHAAVWHEDGFVNYNSSQEEWAFAVSSSTPEGQATRVRAMTINSILRESGFDHADFTKIDIEGAEFNILQPRADWFTRAGHLKIEIHPPASIQAAANALELAGLITWKDTRHWSCLNAA